MFSSTLALSHIWVSTELQHHLPSDSWPQYPFAAMPNILSVKMMVTKVTSLTKPLSWSRPYFLLFPCVLPSSIPVVGSTYVNKMGSVKMSVVAIAKTQMTRRDNSLCECRGWKKRQNSPALDEVKARKQASSQPLPAEQNLTERSKSFKSLVKGKVMM